MIEGTIGPGEYSGNSVGVGNGFGEMIGTNVEMYVDSDASGNLAFAIDAVGASCSWGADDTVVIYVDAIPGVGFADTTGFTDNSDSGRAAASGMGTDGSRADLTFAPDFRPDHAIVLRADSASLFRLAAGVPHAFVRSLTRAPEPGFGTACVREVGGISMSDLGSQPGNPLRWIATLMNATNAFRSNEFQGAAAAPAMNIGAAPFTFAAGDRNIFTSEGVPLAMRGPVSWLDFGNFAGAGFTPTPTCGQLSSNNWAVTGLSDGALAFGGTQATPATDYTRGLSAIGVSTGGIYAFVPAPNDRALGLQQASGDFVPGSLTLRLENATSSIVSSAIVAYRALARNDSGRSSSIAFAWSLNGTSFTAEPTLTFTSPDVATPSPAPWTSTPRMIVLNDLNIPAGGFLFVRFTLADVGGTGGRDELGLDDIIVWPTTTNCGDGDVDAGEACDTGAANGTTICGCQANCAFAAATVDCGGGGLGVCDLPDTCDGAGACADRVLGSSMECRPATGGPCDAAESCDGVGHDCPADGVRGAGSVCSPAEPGQPCDADDICDGATTGCAPRVADSSTSCRSSTGLCDLGASCDGVTTGCPPSVPAANTVVCRGSLGICDVAETCTGSSIACPTNAVSMSGVPCRAAAGVCDVAETCDGVNPACPNDLFVPNDTPCADGLVCNGAERCTGGACMASPLDCADTNLCTTDTCGEPGGCAHAPVPGCCNLDADCADSDVCTVGTCSGPGGSCSTSTISNCCTEDSDCMDASACTTDSCNLSTNRCTFAPIPSCCTVDADCNDGDICTAETCGAGGNCAITPIADCCESAADCDDGDACTSDVCGGNNRCTHAAIPSCCVDLADCDDGDACTVDRCDGSTMRCAADPMDCDDGDACTTDACVAGSCESTPSCADGGVADGGTADGGVRRDAGSTTPDASSMIDGGPDAGVGVSGGGCGCRVGAARTPSPLWLALGALALLIRRRRR